MPGNAPTPTENALEFDFRNRKKREDKEKEKSALIGRIKVKSQISNAKKTRNFQFISGFYRNSIRYSILMLI